MQARKSSGKDVSVRGTLTSPNSGVGIDWHGFDAIGQQAARALREVLRSQNVVAPDVTFVACEKTTLSDWARSDAHSAMLGRLHMSSSPGNGGLAIPTRLIFNLVDLLFGGDGRSEMVRDELSSAERRFGETFMGTALAALNIGLLEGAHQQAELVSLEKTVAKLLVGRADHQIFELRWRIRGQNIVDADITMALPANMVEDMAADTSPSQLAAENAASTNWREMLNSASQQITVPVRTVFARPEVGIETLISLKIGDIIPICLPRKLPVSVSGMIFAYGSLGESDGRAAILLETMEQRHEYEN